MGNPPIGDAVPVVYGAWAMPFTILKLPTRRNKMKLTANTLDNEVKSAVINIGSKGAHIEAYINDSRSSTPELCIDFYNSRGRVFSREAIPLSLFTSRSK